MLLVIPSELISNLVARNVAQDLAATGTAALSFAAE
jgi:hypothetical protein